MHRLSIILLSFTVLSCAATRPPAPPWEQPPVAPYDVAPAFITEWRRAENRATCALIAPRSLGGVRDATPRAATFAGGWAVAYDTPSQRSAFGVAGTGVKADDASYSLWPYKITWSDGSTAGYGPEGGTGPNDLAYLRIAGQQCLYNVWSSLGREHLERLLDELRFVRSDRTGG